MASSGKPSVQELDATVCKDATKFTKLYYDALDKRRAQVSKMYTGAACLVWNGTAMAGQEQIHAFLTNLPPTDHNVTCFDASPVPERISGGSKTILIQAAGTVRYNERNRMFSQTFILSTENDLLKIASDRFRFID